MYHIVYKTINKINGKIYIGKHSSKVIHDNYLGSGTLISRAIKKYGIENFYRENLFIFDTEEEALEKEKELVTKEFCLREDTYNIFIGGYGNKNREFLAKDSNGNVIITRMDDPRLKNGELVLFCKGRSTFIDEEKNIYSLDKNDDLIKEKNLKGIMKGKVTVKDKDGNTFSVNKDDPRYISGELTHIFKNTISVKDKDGNKFHVSKDDPRYISGELVGIRRNGKPTTKGKIGITDGKSMRFISPGDIIPEGWIKGVSENFKNNSKIENKNIIKGKDGKFIRKIS